MKTEGDARSPVQETYSKDTGHLTSIKQMQKGSNLKEPPLSVEETGPDHKPSTCNGQDHMDFSCHGPKSNASEDKRKTLDDSSAKDNVSTDFKQDGNNTMSCVDVLAHYEGNIVSPLVCQTGRHSSSDCIGNQIPNILKIDVGTSTDPNDTLSKSKKRRRNKCRADHLSIDRNPEDNISSGQERNKIGLNSQNQAPVIEKSPNALSTTSDTSFQQDDNASVITKPSHHTSLSQASENYTISGSQTEGERPSRASKPSSGSTVLRNASNNFLMIFHNFKILVVLISVATTMAQAYPVQKQWQQFQFCSKDGPLNDQPLTIINTEDRNSEALTVNFSSVPFFKNCSESRSLFFVENSTCVDMLTEDLTTEHMSMEHGKNRSGKSLPAVRGGRVNEKSVWEKVAKFTETADGSAHRLSAEDSTPTDASRTQKLWQQFRFHMTKGSLIGQVLTIKDMKDLRSEGCTFKIGVVPFFKNCSQAGVLVFVENQTCAEILTEDLTAEDWRMEYGFTRNGDGLLATRGETLNEKSVLKKIAEYTKKDDNSAQGWSAEDIVKTAAGIGVPILLLIPLFFLYKFHQKFKRWVNKVVCRRGRRDSNNIPGANPESGTNSMPLVPKTSTNGTTNGSLQNGESKSETLSVGLLETDKI